MLPSTAVSLLLLLSPVLGLVSITRRTGGGTRLRKSWFDDDLPKILGINPIEASLVLGALYYFYGPNVLYEYAREAGKLFSTYAPVVRDVASDIFLEFRDYLEVGVSRRPLGCPHGEHSGGPRA